MEFDRRKLLLGAVGVVASTALADACTPSAQYKFWPVRTGQDANVCSLARRMIEAAEHFQNNVVDDWEIKDGVFRRKVEQHFARINARWCIKDVYEARIACDMTNNTPDVVERGGWVFDWWVKPVRSAEVLHLPYGWDPIAGPSARSISIPILKSTSL